MQPPVKRKVERRTVLRGTAPSRCPQGPRGQPDGERGRQKIQPGTLAGLNTHHHMAWYSMLRYAPLVANRE